MGCLCNYLQLSDDHDAMLEVGQPRGYSVDMDPGRFVAMCGGTLITNSSERPIIERINNRYFGNDLLGTCSLHFTSQQYKRSNGMIRIVCLKIVHH